jgi:hypothetical protein
MKHTNRVSILCGLVGLGTIIYGGYEVASSIDDGEMSNASLSALFAGVFFEILACKLYSNEETDVNILGAEEYMIASGEK